MTLPGRFLVRIFSYIGYLFVVAAAFTFVISDLLWLRFLGGFFALFLADLWIHHGEADRQLDEMPREGEINLAEYLAPKAFHIIEKAHDRSILTKKNFYLETAKQLLEFKEIKEGLRRLDVKPEEFKQKAEELLLESDGGAGPRGGAVSKGERRAQIETLVILALKQALDARHNFIELSDIFSALPIVGEGWLRRLFDMFEIDAGDLSRALIFGTALRGKILRRTPLNLGGFVFESHRKIRHRIMNRAWTARPTPTLDKYSVDLTDLARQGAVGFLVGHEAEFNRLVDTLARPINPNVLLVGEVGIGKETLVTHLAFKLIKDEVPKSLFDKRLVSLDISMLIAGAPPEELNRRLKAIVEEIFIAGNVILYIRDIHNLVNTSGTAYLSAADALMPVIISNTFPIIGSTYPREFKRFIEPRSDFAGVFEIVRMQEISSEEAEKILTYESLILEKQYKITISFGAVKKAVVLAKKYLHDRFLPSSADELLKSALVETKRRGAKFVGPEEVVVAAEEKTKVPIRGADEAESKKLLNLEETIHERLINQDEAVKVVSDSIRQYRSGLARQGGPIASFLFVGPTGVGKTELAKILAKVQFGREKEMIRFDMTEYQNKQSFYRFIGSPDGSTRGALTDAVLERPYSLILLDEFEKAFPDILQLFLQVFDDGRLTDNAGRVVDFENTIIIATSNAHSDIINEALVKGQTMADIADYLKRRLVDVFKPELLNRFSKVVVFRNLLPKELISIVWLNLKDVAALIAEQGIVLEFDPAAVEAIAKMGHEPAFGARPLRRVIEEKVRAPLATAILEKKIGRGSRIKMVLKDEKKFEFVDVR